MYKKSFFISILLGWSLVAAYAQHGCFEIDWAYNYGGSQRDWGNDIALTDDGGYIVSGYSRSSNLDVGGNNGDWDFWVIRLDEEGQMLWETNLGGSINDEATSVEQTSDGGFVVAGSTYSNDGNVAFNNGDEDFWVTKLSANGNLQWERSYGGSDVDRAEAIRQTPDGGYVVAGFSASQNGDVGDNYGNFDCWVIRLDSNGNLLWEKNYGGSGADWAYELDLTNDGGYIFAGSTISDDDDVSDNNGFYDYWVVKIDDSGNLLWENNFGGAGEDRAYAVYTTANGDYLVGGSSYSNNFDVSGNNGGSDFWVLRLDNNGALLWERNLGGMGSEWAWGLDATIDDGLVVCGRTNTGNGSGDVSGTNGGIDFWLVKLDSDGQLEWENTYGGSSNEVPYSVTQTPDEGFVLAGYSQSSDGDVVDNYGDWDYWVLKISPRELELDLGNDTLLCADATLDLDASIDDPAATYEWSDGLTDPLRTIDAPGTYRVEARVDDCVIEDSITINYLVSEPINLGPDTAFCAFEPYLLEANLPIAETYLWQDGSTDSVFTVQESGTYWVEATVGECLLDDTIRVTFDNPQIELGQDTFLCEGDFVVINAYYENATYLWQDGSANQNYIATDTGTYSVIVDVNGCQTTDTIHLRWCEKFRDPCLEIPNAFTPNGDAVNDLFQLHDYCRFNNYRLSIFNRWGDQIFQTTDPDAGWDGRYRGSKCQQGVYVYLIEYDYTYEGQTYEEHRKGSFTLIR